MEELFRFQQVRNTQSLPEEQHAAVGLLLYPAGKLSQLATALQNPALSNETFDSVVKKYSGQNDGKIVITDTSQVNAVLLGIYDWLNFKARPLKLNDFKSFIDSLKNDNTLNLTDQWNWLADNLLLAIDNKKISINHCVDLQMLIRACYFFKLCLEEQDGKLNVSAKITSDFLNQLLTVPLVIPRGVIRSRCTQNCKDSSAIDIKSTGNYQLIVGNNPCQSQVDTACKPPSTHCICIKTYVSDLFVVKEELARFEEGEIADIENILAGEKREHRHRTLLRTENTTQTDNETDTSEERDHQVNDKSSLQDEVKNTVDSKTNVDAGITATYKYGTMLTLTPHVNVTANFSKSQSQDTARSYAKEIVDRSVSTMQQKVQTIQISKVINEVEEKNMDSVDNTQPGNDHRAGIYYWVNKVTHAQVFNYGKHTMFDLILPEPAATYKVLYQQNLAGNQAQNAPVKPTLLPANIQRNNYGSILNQYGISSTDELEPPDDTTAIQVAFSKDIAGPDDNKTMSFSSNEFKSPDIPAGYKAATMSYDIRCSTGHPKSTDKDDQVAVSVHCGSVCLLSKVLDEWSQGSQQNQDWASSAVNFAMNGEEGNVTVSMAAFSSLALSLSGTMSISCKLKDEAFAKWQCSIYNLVMTDYNKKLDAYNQAQGSDTDLVQIKGNNPFLNRETERNEIKRHIVSILMCNYFNGMGSMMEKVAPGGFPEIDFAKLERDAPIIQFFEQVFEWEYMNYLFYHSMWARKSKWPELIFEDSGDPLFDKFLTAGAARVQVPVRNGMEDVFCWFLKTNQIWGASGIPPVSGDDDYVSMIQELKEADGGDYSDRPGFIQATNGNAVLQLTSSTYYYDLVNDQVNQANIDNDVDRELLVNYKIYRIVKVEQPNAGDNTTWNITIDRGYEDATAANLKHAVGAVFVGAPWEIVVPTSLVYLRNKTDKLPTYPLT